MAKCTVLVITDVTKQIKICHRSSCFHDNRAYETDKRVSSLNASDGAQIVLLSCIYRAFSVPLSIPRACFYRACILRKRSCFDRTSGHTFVVRAVKSVRSCSLLVFLILLCGVMYSQCSFNAFRENNVTAGRSKSLSPLFFYLLKVHTPYRKRYFSQKILKKENLGYEILQHLT